MPRSRLLAPVLALLALSAMAGPAWAAKPEIIRDSFTETFDDEILTDACGVPVVSTATGHITNRTFDRDGTGPLEVFTINVSIVATSDGNSYRFRDVGADVTRRTSDGTTIVTSIGQLPFLLKGSEVRDAVTDELIREAHRRESTAAVCAALTA